MNRLDSADTTWLTSDFLKNETFKNWRYENLCMRSETFTFDSPMTQQLNQYRENVSRRIYSTFSNEFTTCGLKHKFKLWIMNKMKRNIVFQPKFRHKSMNQYDHSFFFF